LKDYWCCSYFSKQKQECYQRKDLDSFEAGNSVADACYIAAAAAVFVAEH
jgi:hypothetical protein